jgi:hypothetical protein
VAATSHALPASRTTLPAATRPWWRDGRVLAGGAALLAYLALGLALARGLGYHEPDALSRTANAYLALLGREPRLAVLGAVWTPLPALAQMPFLLLLWPFGLQPLAGMVVSCIATVATLLLLDDLARALELPRPLRLGLVLLYAVHPMVVLFAVNGQTEALFLMLVVAIVGQLVRWADDLNVERVLVMGYLAAAAFLVRYESVPLALAVLLGMLARQAAANRRDRGAILGVACYFGIPVLIAIGYWLKFNWDVTGDPLFFLWGPYSNAAQTAAHRLPGHDLYAYYGDWGAALELVLARALLLAPALAVVAPLVVLEAVARRAWAPALAAWAFGVLLLFGAVKLFAGQSTAHLRFYLSAVPAATVLACLAWRRAPGRLRPLVGGAALLAAVAAIPTTLAAMADPTIGRMEWGILAHLEGRPYEPRAFTRFASERAVARDLDARATRSPVLLDLPVGFPVVAFSAYPGQFVATPDSDFEHLLAHPHGNVGHILVHDPADPTDPNPMSAYGRILKVHPDLLAGAPWASLEREYGAWKLYRVVAPPPTQLP